MRILYLYTISFILTIISGIISLFLAILINYIGVLFVFFYLFGIIPLLCRGLMYLIKEKNEQAIEIRTWTRWHRPHIDSIYSYTKAIVVAIVIITIIYIAIMIIYSLLYLIPIIFNLINVYILMHWGVNKPKKLSEREKQTKENPSKSLKKLLKQHKKRKRHS